MKIMEIKPLTIEENLKLEREKILTTAWYENSYFRYLNQLQSYQEEINRLEKRIIKIRDKQKALIAQNKAESFGKMPPREEKRARKW